MTDVERMARFVERMGFDKDTGCGAIGQAFDYSHRLRGYDYDTLREDWAAVERLSKRAMARRKEQANVSG